MSGCCSSKVSTSTIIRLIQKLQGMCFRALVNASSLTCVGSLPLGSCLERRVDFFLGCGTEAGQVPASRRSFKVRHRTSAKLRLECQAEAIPSQTRLVRL